jgi:hypothetical protein
MDRSSAPPLFLGDVEPRLGGVPQEAALVLAAAPDDGVLAGVEDRAIRGGGGEVLHLGDEVGRAADQALVVGIDLQADHLPCHGAPRG